MSDDGIRLQLKGSTFKVELLQVVGAVFETVAKTFVTIKTGGALLSVYPNLITGLFGALKGVKISESMELRAWLLVSGGLLYALEKAISETDLQPQPSAGDLKRLIDDIGIRIQTRTYAIEPAFFDAPNSLALLDDVAHEFSAWMARFGGKDKPKEAIIKLEKHFPTGLHRTWMKDVSRFESLEAALNSPFKASVQLRHQLEGYLQYLEEQFTELRLIGQEEDDPDAVKLSRVFVPLRSYFEQRQKQTDHRNASKGTRDDPEPDLMGHTTDARRPVLYLFDALERWIKACDKRDALRIISGGPGIGKSSSMRAFAAEIARSRAAYPLLVPLQKLEKADQPLRDRVKDYLINNRAIPLKKSPLEVDEPFISPKPILIIFDGLDELVRPGKDADEIAREFMSDLRVLLDQENTQASSSLARLLCIVTGRVAAAGSASRALKCTGEQILHLLKFSESQKQYFFDPNRLLEEDQRITWWHLWQSAAKTVPDKIPDILLHNDLFDITIEPLLLYFVAFVRPWETGETFDRNEIYDRLLQDFYNREVAKGVRNFATEFPDFPKYEVVLQAMALACWYDGSTRTGTTDMVKQLLRDMNEDIMLSFGKIIGNEKPAIGAALAFYMKPGERPNSFEFLHKTFAEYLVSRRLVDWIKYAAEEFVDSKNTHGLRKRTFDVNPHLREWIRLTGPRPMDFDLLRFLRAEIARRYAVNAADVRHWREMLISCFQISLRDGIPAHMLFGLPDHSLVLRHQRFKDAIEQARNAEETLLAAINATILPELGDPGFRPVDVRFPGHDFTSLGGLIHRLIGQRLMGLVIASTLFSGIDFSNERLLFQDMYHMAAVRSDFSGASLLYSVLDWGTFRESRFEYADLRYARLSQADFTGANMKGAILEDAVDLESARLSKDQIMSARLSKQQLELIEATRDDREEGKKGRGRRR
jgi:hypothetical protein